MCDQHRDKVAPETHKNGFRKFLRGAKIRQFMIELKIHKSYRIYIYLWKPNITKKSHITEYFKPYFLEIIDFHQHIFTFLLSNFQGKLLCFLFLIQIQREEVLLKNTCFEKKCTVTHRKFTNFLFFFRLHQIRSLSPLIFTPDSCCWLAGKQAYSAKLK